MKIETFDREDHQKNVVVEFDSDTLERYKRQAARKIATETKIPGFRPGKAPYDMVRRMTGDKPIQDEAVSLMLDEVYPQILKESGIESYGPGSLEEILSVDPPKFSFIIPLAPVVTLGEYKEIRLEHNLPTIADDKVEEVIERLRRRVGTAAPVERPAEKGDLVAVKLSANLTEVAEEGEAALIEENSYEMVAGTPEDHTDEDGHEWPYKGFVNELVGMKNGDKKTILHTFTDDGSDDDLTGKTAEFTFEIESVKEITKPELDEEFVKSLGPYEDLEALRNDIKRQLLETDTKNYNRKYFDELIEKLMADAKVEYPPILLDDEIEHMLVHFEQDLSRQKLDLDTYLKTRELTREELIDKEIKPAAEQRVKRQLVLEKFAAEENIQIQPHEVQMVYNMAVDQAKRDPKMASMRTGKTNPKDLVDTLARGTINEIFNQRLINRLRDIATGKADAPAEEADVESDETVVETVAETIAETDAETASDAAVEATDAVTESPEAAVEASTVAAEEQPTETLAEESGSQSAE